MLELGISKLKELRERKNHCATGATLLQPVEDGKRATTGSRKIAQDVKMTPELVHPIVHRLNDSHWPPGLEAVTILLIATNSKLI